jgi:hypothetical protein
MEMFIHLRVLASSCRFRRHCRSHSEFMAQEGLYFISNCITNDDVPFVATT